jgi:hypothetical protein
MPKWAELSNKERSILIHDQVMHMGTEYVPDYTADMNAALTVVEKMRAHGWRGFELSATISEGRYRVRFETFDLGLTGRDNVAIEIEPAEAICHAAALAVGAVEE